MANTPKILQMLINFLSGRKIQLKPNLRYDEISKRTQPPPVIPLGPSHKFANNYYCTRDGRRLAKPPTVIMLSQKAITAGSQVAVKSKCPVTPGSVYKEPPLSTDEPYL
ncbi:NADH dehydrogenase [ubiquinone] 1 alpha subcomplex subunit 7 [Nematolebias whitei]|uniref:NADH dehydrogenase [ubiquinone] 1 alpha subcomplex subunit 7 n=1 Tax=Nematolebias whitei TaxID=451745 RepID=UPI00189B1470|nr:NADH dehydrogenase [ubiquinone] 1 alpha subcomplex subunit 7 [Nematolebias whitei]